MIFTLTNREDFDDPTCQRRSTLHQHSGSSRNNLTPKPSRVSYKIGSFETVSEPPPEQLRVCLWSAWCGFGPQQQQQKREETTGRSGGCEFSSTKSLSHRLFTLNFDFSVVDDVVHVLEEKCISGGGDQAPDQLSSSFRFY